MKLLLLSAFRHRKHYVLLVATFISICFLTMASQMEICALGVITNKGPDFFELFAPVKGGKIAKEESISHQEVEQRWKEIDSTDKGYITKADTTNFLAAQKGRSIIDQVIGYLDKFMGITGNLINLAILLVVVALFKAITLFSHRYTTRLIAIRVSCDLRQEYFEHIQSLPMSFYQKYNIGSLSSRVVGDAILIAESINACLVNYFQTPFTLITTLTLCFLTSWKLTLVIFCGFPLIVLPIILLAKRVKRVSKQIQKNQENFASVLIDFLAGIQTVKVFAMEKFSLKKYREHNYKMAALEQKSARYDLSSRPILHTIGMFFLATALMYGLYGLKMNVSDILFYCGLLYVFYEPIKKFAEENSHIQRGVAAAERMFEVMALKPNINDADGAVVWNDFKESIEFDDVWFRYEDQWVLKGVSFTIKKGESVAIVGPTGAGKSTIVQLLPRLYDVEKGEIRIDGKPLCAYTQRSLRDNIAFIPQKPFLFLDSIAENIAFGRDFSRQEILEASHKAHADEFICKLPNGYDTQLSEMGKNLSGGQQQRLAIARALVKKAPVLVMDEATSSLDALSENRIKLAIQEMKGSMTQIIIAHRLATIENVDKIIYLENGVKVAEGSKDELLQSCPNFRFMWEAGQGSPAKVEV